MCRLFMCLEWRPVSRVYEYLFLGLEKWFTVWLGGFIGELRQLLEAVHVCTTGYNDWKVLKCTIAVAQSMANVKPLTLRPCSAASLGVPKFPFRFGCPLCDHMLGSKFGKVEDLATKPQGFGYGIFANPYLGFSHPVSLLLTTFMC